VLKEFYFSRYLKVTLVIKKGKEEDWRGRMGTYLKEISLEFTILSTTTQFGLYQLHCGRFGENSCCSAYYQAQGEVTA